jgi:hypothetical protein
VVGRLVEQQQVRPRGEQAEQAELGLFPAAERANALLRPHGAQTERAAGRLDRGEGWGTLQRVHRPRVGVRCIRRALRVGLRGHPRRQLRQSLLRRRDGEQRREHLGHGPIVGPRVPLPKIAEPHVGGDLDAAGVGALLAHDDA